MITLRCADKSDADMLPGGQEGKQIVGCGMQMKAIWGKSVRVCKIPAVLQPFPESS